MTTSNLDISQFDHTPFYCEENVYMLCKKLGMIGMADAEGSDLFAVFISNEKKQVPLWHQKASKRADGIILWDYHVICIQKKKEGSSPPQVWDLDSSLPFPSHLDHYMSDSFRPSFQLFFDYQRFFRIVHAPLFLHSFASDRRHMKNSDGNWIPPPPAQDPIVADDGSLYNLDEYIRMNAADAVTEVKDDTISAVFTQKYGVLVRESQLEEFFSLLSG
ncbi:protein N-terminal glutamine amidohydrolase isoform X1 [Vitis riparia]|uniref:protein N-terminal glutamine amidohydrolase isoform X1 n=2 Tax=Vitis riparia TaxID=96939 RepID=UPI00155ADB69|nr:protein N-terminal glutamine amidohydrolase isoform X1 [Vitis riparia]